MVVLRLESICFNLIAAFTSVGVGVGGHLPDTYCGSFLPSSIKAFLSFSLQG